ncbi:MAG: response regulator [Gemmatimonadaceae bacterium]|nr:response regulator [Chitinophagaceae bacterium]
MNKKKVLIIDDETDFCLLLQSFFSRKNYEVHLSNSLEAGMDALQRAKPDIVFLDNNLPDGLGWEKAEFILEQFPYLQLNLISAYHYDVPKSDGTASFRIWEKPINLAELNRHFA